MPKPNCPSSTSSLLMSEEKKDMETPASPPTVPEDPNLQKQEGTPPSEEPEAFPPRSPRPDQERGSIQDEASIGEDSIMSGVGADKTGVSFDLESSIEDAVVLVPGDEGDNVLGPIPINEREATKEEVS